MILCNECNKEFKSIQGLGRHKRMHDQNKPLRKLEYTCINCNTSGTYDPASSKGKFCNNKCQGEYVVKQTFLRVEQGLGTSTALKSYLIHQHGYQCTICKIGDWMGKPISLHLDHIDGNSDNNLVSNGRILCPNCHSQTETFCGKNIKNTKRNRYLQVYKSEKKQKRS
jgi:5-methylcytosine-specific restriction endonuclease McrA